MNSFVDTLGLIAGSVWVCAALYFQLIKPDEVHPKYVIGLFLVGAGIIMGSAAAAVAGRPVLVQTLATLANVIFLMLGAVAWLHIDRHADGQRRPQLSEESYRVE